MVRGVHTSAALETSPVSVQIVEEAHEVTYKDSCLAGVAGFACIEFESFDTAWQALSAPGVCPSAQGAGFQLLHCIVDPLDPPAPGKVELGFTERDITLPLP